MILFGRRLTAASARAGSAIDSRIVAASAFHTLARFKPRVAAIASRDPFTPMRAGITTLAGKILRLLGFPLTWG